MLVELDFVMSSKESENWYLSESSISLINQLKASVAFTVR